MRQLIRRFSRVADSTAAAATSYRLLRSDSLSSPLLRRIGRKSPVPPGHVPVYVGDEMERFAVSADLLNHPIFVKLLNRSAQEYGYQQQGVLRIPCRVSVFESVLAALRSGGRSVSADVLDFIDPLSPHDADDRFF